MNESGPALKVGVLTVVALALTAGYVLFVADNPVAGRRTKSFSVRVASAKGLLPKSQVLVSGIEVGKIDDITLGPDGRSALVHISVRDDLNLYGNAAARRVSEALLGSSLIELDPGTPEAGPIAANASIPTEGGEGDLDSLMAKASPIADDVKAITAAIRQFVEAQGESRSRFEEITTRIASITEQLDRGLGANLAAVERILKNAERASVDVNAITAESRGEIRTILVEMRNLVAGLGSQAQGADGPVGRSLQSLERTMVRLERIVAKIDRSAGDVEAVTENVREGRGTVGRLLNDETIARNVESISERAGDFVNRFDRLETWFHVESNVFGRTGEIKNFINLRLRPHPYKYILFGVVDDPRFSTSYQRSVTRTTDSTRDPWVFEERTTTKRALKLSLLYAQSFPVSSWFYPTIRFGLLENFGGGGLDLHFWGDRIRVITDVFDFSPQAKPRLRSQLQAEVWKRIYVSGGFDDTLNRGWRDWFLGAGIMFNDEDIKAILPFAAPAAGGLNR